MTQQHTPKIDWTVSREEVEEIRDIVKRVQRECPGLFDTMTLTMDLTACHRNGCPLKLAELAAADTPNFIHDVAGIAQHIDRVTGELRDCFVPRYAVREAVSQ